MLILSFVCIAGFLAVSLSLTNFEDVRARGREHYELVRFSIATRGLCMIACLTACAALQIYAWATRVE